MIGVQVKKRKEMKHLMIGLIGLLSFTTAHANIVNGTVSDACGEVVDLGTTSATKGLRIETPGRMTRGPQLEVGQVVVLADLSALLTGWPRASDAITALTIGEKICVDASHPASNLSVFSPSRIRSQN